MVVSYKRLNFDFFVSTGAIMIFMPSFFDILSFRDILFERESELVSSGGSFILRFLYSNMQTSEQKLIFQIPPTDCRKIILSTNVGAIGITISDLVYIIDTGKIEQKMFVDHTGKLSFVTGWISSSHALQRSTKIGRLHPGCCYRLYSQLMTLPEKNPAVNLYTCSPQILCLYTKQMVPYDVPVNFYLQRALTVPEESTLKQSIDILKSIDAFDICKNYEQLTDLGKIMLQLPLEPQYAKMVLYSVALKCLDPVLTIAAFSKHKSIFKLEEKYKSKSHIAAKEWKKISSKYFSDHLVLIKLFLGRLNAGIDKQEKMFCDDFCISQSTMELVNTTRSNIVGHLRAMGIVKTRGVNDMRDLNSNSKEWVFVKAALVGGLYPNLVFVDRTSNKLKSGKNKNEVIFHPLSVLQDYSSLPSNQTVMLTQEDIVQNLPTDWIISNEISNSYLDEIFTASVCTAVTPITLALFAGSYKICAALQNQRTALLIQNANIDFKESDSEDDEKDQNLKNFMIDSYLQFSMNDETAKAVLYLRIKWFSYFFRCIRFPSKIMANEEKQLLELLANVLKSEEKYKFPAGDPDFIGHKPAAYTIDLLQQPAHNQALADVNVANSNPALPGLITENSRYFLIKSYNQNNITASILNGIWRFEQSTEMLLLDVFKTGAEVKLIFQFTGTNCFQGVAMLLSDRYCNSELNFLPIQWLKEGLVPMSVVEEYVDASTCSRLTASADGTEIDISLASTLMMMWNTSHVPL